MKEREYQAAARRLGQQLQTVEALASYNRRRLEQLADRPRKQRTAEATRDIQSELEEAERLLAVTAQDLADLET